MSTPDKVEEFYQHMLKSTPVLNEFERASLKLKFKELLTQYHQDLQEKHEREKRELVDLIISKATEDDWGCLNVYVSQIQQIADHHGLSTKE